MSSSLPGRTRTWPTRIIGVLLLLQAAGLAGLSGYVLADAGATGGAGGGPLGLAALGAPLAALAALSFVGGIGFLFLLRFGWLLAMASQGLILLFGLNQYFFGLRPNFIYAVMIYGVLMVLYLNSSGVRTVFRPGREADGGSGS